MGFLDLPREIRDLVYAFAFRVDGAIFLYSPNPYVLTAITKAKVVRYKDHGPPEPKPVRRFMPSALLRSCRQMHAEASPVLYGANIFRIWYLGDAEMRSYRHLLRHVVFTSDLDHRIFGRGLEEVAYGWRRRFWPTLIQNALEMLERFPGLETLTFPIEPPFRKEGEEWRPAFFNVSHKTREQRVALAANWLRYKCPIENERLRKVLLVEVVPRTRAPKKKVEKEEYVGSRFEPEDDEEEQNEEDEGWDCTEFAEAFKLTKSLL